MKVLQELTQLNEISMQASIKQNMKECGSFSEIFGKDAEEVAKAMHDDLDAKLYCLDTSSELGKTLAKGAQAAPVIDVAGRTKIVRLMSSNRLALSNGKVYIGEYYLNRLI